MASNTITRRGVPLNKTIESISEPQSFGQVVRIVLQPLASLKLTVVLFALAIFIIFVGTLAQTQKDMWQVLNDYFCAYFTWIEWQIFFPRAWFPNLQNISGGFYFVGGASIGLAMAVNLVAAHAVRFKLQTRGTRLLAGLAVLTIGGLATWLVIASGHNQQGLQGKPPFEWSTMWLGIKSGLLLSWFLGLVAVPVLTLLWVLRSQTMGQIKMLAVVLGACLLLCFGGWGWWTFFRSEAALADPSLRILWQLIQSSLAALALLGGCVLLFRKRAGVVLLHAGLGLMMFGQLLVSKYAVEEQMMIEEGQTVNFAKDIRSVELAIVDTSPRNTDEVVVVPVWVSGRESSFLREAAAQPQWLPFDIQFVEYYKNADLRDVKAGEQNPATAGLGRQLVAENVRAGSGTDSSGQVDLAAAYVKFTEKSSSQDLGTYLLSQILSEQDRAEKLTVDGKTYDLYLRFKRSYKPYSLQLVDVRKDDYIGTTTPRNYSSEVHLRDPERGIDRSNIRIWMNNPLRYAGETFYQSSYHKGPKTVIDSVTGANTTKVVETTTLAVVTNTGWMIPYVACMIVATGLLFHFSLSLVRFLNRRMAAQAPQAITVADSLQPPVPAKLGRKGKRYARASAPVVAEVSPGGWMRYAQYVFPAGIVIVCAAWIVGAAMPPSADNDQMNLDEFGKLPVVFEGRAKPFDTLARNCLRVISNRDDFVDPSGTTRPAIVWMLDVITQSERAEKHRVFRIESLDVLATLGLEPRAGFRYSVQELRGGIEEFEKQADKARSLDAEQLDLYQKKILELDRRIRTFTLLAAAFRPLPIPPVPTEQEFDQDPRAAAQTAMQIKQMLQAMPQANSMLVSMQPPLAVPADSRDRELSQDWLPYATAWNNAYIQSAILKQEVNPATLSLKAIFDAYLEGDVQAFNREVAKYQATLERNPPSQLDVAKTDFEVFFNHFAPFYHAAALYVIAFVLAALAWLGWSRPLNRAAFWLIVFTLAVHSFALIARIYISGRPPVTNLYSSAVFIGWGCVVLGLVLEIVYRLGIGNVIASVAGFATLLIAHLLTTAVPSFRGDTFTVMQAVLDTQFWLATHVVCITMGYATTYLAGLLGIGYILGGVLTPSLSPRVGKELSRMIYGTVCFAIFFSFVGTVLGGLWADDSWGRFWGWDPKENGALIIVLWNALLLHARWDGLVKERGIAMLAVGGNIVTSWSWFGVNELGIGLHSYGFTEGVLLVLGGFVASQLAIILIAALPQKAWWSFRRRTIDERRVLKANLAEA